MKARILQLVACMMAAAAPLLAQHTYYISKSAGNDAFTTTQAQSKTTPWQHMPGMVTCASTCAGYTPQPGDSFILKGGDTWNSSDLGLAWGWAGSSGAKIYIGVDLTWFVGGSWTRPIFTFNGHYGSGTGLHITRMIYVNQPWIIFDNIEFTGFGTSSSSGGDIVENTAQNNEFEHLYIHGWSHSTSVDSDTANAFGFGTASIAGSSVHDSIIDGSDTTRDMLCAFNGTIPIAYKNYVQYVTNGFEAVGDNWHDNYVANIGKSFAWAYGPQHQNAMFHFGPAYASSVLLYNNVITLTNTSLCADVCGGIVKFWVNGNETTTAQVYAFNIVMYDNSTSNFINFGAHPAGNYGTLNLFNNTIECGNDTTTQQCINDSGADPGRVETFNSYGNHWISNQSPIYTCTVFTCSSTADVLQTVSAANLQGYNSSQNPPFHAINSAGATVNESPVSGYCTTVTGIDSSAGAACNQSSTFAVSYLTTNHTVVYPAVATVPRPTTGNTDAGAWQFSGTPTVPTPAISPTSGPEPNPVLVMVGCSSGATCHYTQDSSTPTCSSATYSSGVLQTVPGTFKVLGCETGYTNSAVATAIYTLRATIYVVQPGGSTGGTATFGSAVTAGDALYAMVYGFPAFTTISVRSTYETFTTEATGQLATDNDQIAIACAIASGTHTDTVTATATGGSGPGISRIQLYEVHGASCNLDSTMPAGGFVVTDTTQTTPIAGASITTSTANDAMIFYAANAGPATRASDTWTAGGSFLNLTCVSEAAYQPGCSITGTTDALRTGVEFLDLVTPGASSASINSSYGVSQEYGTIYAAFKPQSTPSPSAPTNLFIEIPGP